MKGAEFSDIRAQLGLDRGQMADLLGYTGDRDNMRNTVKRYEQYQRPIPPWIARLAWLALEYTNNAGHLPEFPAMCDETPLEE